MDNIKNYANLVDLFRLNFETKIQTLANQIRKTLVVPLCKKYNLLFSDGTFYTRRQDGEREYWITITRFRPSAGYSDWVNIKMVKEVQDLYGVLDIDVLPTSASPIWAYMDDYPAEPGSPAEEDTE